MVEQICRLIQAYTPFLYSFWSLFPGSYASSFEDIVHQAEGHFCWTS